MHYDVKFGKAVIMTVTDVHAAADLASALTAAAESGFQTEGLKSSVVECDRGDGILKSAPPVEKDEEPEDEYYALNAKEAKEHIRENSDPDILREDIQREKDHPRFDGGRKGVIDDAEEYLGELTS